MEHLRRWISGFVLASLIMWAGSWFFLGSVMPLVSDPTVDSLVPPTGHAHRFRSEGWATTSFGRHGIGCIPDVTRVRGPKIAIWGDSYVVALQVPCGSKIAQQVTAVSARSGDRMTGVSIANPNREVADYYHLLPQYEALVDPLCHVICLGSIRDAVPGAGRFRSEPTLELQKLRRAPAMLGIRHWIEDLRLNFLWVVLRKLTYDLSAKSPRKLRFRPGRARPPGGGETPAVPPTEAWDFLLTALTSRATRPVIFLYGPSVPSIRQGAVDFRDPDASLVEAFHRACDANGVPLLDLTGRSCDFHRLTGEFPRGFNNGFPSKGHWNEHGHRLAAEAIVEYVRNHHDVIHAD